MNFNLKMNSSLSIWKSVLVVLLYVLLPVMGFSATVVTVDNTGGEVKSGKCKGME